MPISLHGYNYTRKEMAGYARNVSAFINGSESATLAQINANLLISDLMLYGFSLASACGICGMAMEESALNPGVTGTGGCGFIGWTPPSSLWDYVSPWYYGENQAFVINKEVDGTPPFNGRFFPSTTHPEYSYTGAEFKALTSPVEACKAYFWQRGRGADWVMETAIAIGTDNAAYLYEWYSGTPSPEPPPQPFPPDTPPSPPHFPFTKSGRGRKKKSNPYYIRR